MIKLLIEQHGVSLATLKADGMTVLMSACRKAPADIVDYLLHKTKSNVNAQAQDGMTALMYAAQRSHLDIVKSLLMIGKAQVNLQDKHGYTALMYVITAPSSPSCQAIVQLLLAQHASLHLYTSVSNSSLLLSSFCSSFSYCLRF